MSQGKHQLCFATQSTEFTFQRNQQKIYNSKIVSENYRLRPKGGKSRRRNLIKNTTRFSFFLSFSRLEDETALSIPETSRNRGFLRLTRCFINFNFENFFGRSITIERILPASTSVRSVRLTSCEIINRMLGNLVGNLIETFAYRTSSENFCAH